jgi:hypothetical protein
MMTSPRSLRLAAIAAACLLSACPGRDEKGLDFTKTQREALEKARSVEQAVQDAAAKRAADAERP